MATFADIDPDTDLSRLSCQSLDVSGLPVGEPVAISGEFPPLSRGGGLTLDASGIFIATWASAPPDVYITDVVARRLTACSAAAVDSADAPFRVHDYDRADQTWPGVVWLPDRRFVVVWESRDQYSTAEGVFANKFDADLTPWGNAPW